MTFRCLWKTESTQTLNVILLSWHIHTATRFIHAVAYEYEPGNIRTPKRKEKLAFVIKTEGVILKTSPRFHHVVTATRKI